MDILPFARTNIRVPQPSVEENQIASLSIHENKTYSISCHSDLAPQYAFDGSRYESDDDIAEDVQHYMEQDPPEDLQCFIHEDDADEIFPRILQDDPQFENAPRFADLYYASGQDLNLTSVPHQANEGINCSSTNPSHYQANLVRKVEEYAMLRSALQPDSIPSTSWTSKGPPSFARRVQAKLAAAAEASSSSCDHVFPDSGFNLMTPSSSIVTDTLCRGSMIWNRPGQPHDCVSDATVSNGLLACGDKHTVSTALSTFNSTTSLPYLKDSTLTSGGNLQSKRSPKSPAIIDIDAADYRMDEQACTEFKTHDSELNITQLPTLLVQLKTDKTPIDSSQHQEQVPELQEISEINDSRLGPIHTLESNK
ncbi:hypothetical protein C0992_010362 [Termitomyces sp. T32_za158]|nr:hypothetical protein C0992_010362 [Termitomyces sp. T32_za158]